VLIAPLGRARDITAQTAALIRPPRRVAPSEACRQFLRNEKGQWSEDLSPEMVEPLDMLGSRRYRGIVVVGPIRSGKTFTLVLGSVAYVVTSAPGDMQITQMSREAARDFSRKELDRMLKHSPDVSAHLSPRPRDDNIFDKNFRSGIELKISWPTTTQLASKTLQYAVCTDYDRIENRNDVDGEGPLFELLMKRTATYMSRGKAIAESSPKAVYTQPNWKPSTPHEAPPCDGILQVYNMGTRARRYWQCLHCGEWFQAEPGLGCFPIPSFDVLERDIRDADVMKLSEKYAYVSCRKCGAQHTPGDKTELKRRGKWVHEGEILMPDGSITGERIQTDIASYWLGGVAASYQTWQALIHKYLQAVKTFATTGDEAPLKLTVNADQAAAYIPRAIAKRRGAAGLMARAEHLPRGLIPIEARFLDASVDVQPGRFVVQVHAWGVELESWIIDRFEITSSKRKEGDRTAGLDPASYVEDWDLIIEQVADKSYPFNGMLDVKLSPRLVVVDSGGKTGVTPRAYEFWRRARERGYGARVLLIKGTGYASAARCALTYPDSSGRSDRAGGGRGDVPVLLINSNIIKDGVSNDYARDSAGAGYVHIPDWLEPSWYDELMAETRTMKGWVRQPGQANEAFDLHCYARAGCIAMEAEKINWAAPPEWARPAHLRLPTPATALSGSGQQQQGLRILDNGIE
jgi:phage terminase large subunit GpA-like protein